MAAVSKHPADVIPWLEKVLDSSITYDQITASNRLIENYLEQVEGRWRKDCRDLLWKASVKFCQVKK